MAQHRKTKAWLLLEQNKNEILLLYRDNCSIKDIAKKYLLHHDTVTKYLQSLGINTGISEHRQAAHYKTMIEKYGVKHYLQCAAGQNSYKQSIKNKYGVECVYDDPILKARILEKSKKTSLTRYGKEWVVCDTKYDEQRRKTRIKNGNEVEYNGLNARQLADNLDINLSSFHERVRKVGLELAINTEKHHTCLESIMMKWLDEIGVEYKTQFCVNNRIADFYIPARNLIIEVDGLYWHSDNIIKDNNNHVKKRNIYMEAAYTSLFFRENEIYKQFNIVKSIINNKLNNVQRIGARKCELVELTKGESDVFFSTNHLMGYGKGTGFGLKYSDNIMAAILIKRRKNKEYEISRFASILNYSIAGGFSKLLNFAQNKLQMSSLVTFIDLRYGQGTYLQNLGFQHVGTHTSFKWTDGHGIYNRMQFPNNTGYDKGLFKIWDCGQAKWIKIFQPQTLLNGV
jgi:very-short-patch-repair endonuclease/DNA-binding CsgD family transcriptional regulator